MRLKILLVSDFGRENKIQDYKLNLLVNLLKKIKGRSGLTDFDIYNFNIEDGEFKGVVRLNSLTDYWDGVTEPLKKYDIMIIFNSYYTEDRLSKMLEMLKRFKYQYSYLFQDFDSELLNKKKEKLLRKIMKKVGVPYTSSFKDNRCEILPPFILTSYEYLVPDKLYDTNIITCLMIKDDSYIYYRTIAESLHLFNNERFKWRMDYIDSNESLTDDFIDFWESHLPDSDIRAKFINSGNKEEMLPEDFINRIAISRLVITNDYTLKMLCEMMEVPVRYWNTESVKDFEIDFNSISKYEDEFVEILNEFKINGNYELESY